MAGSPLKSALYFGRMHHRREAPIVHEFGYRLFMTYLDLDELDTVFRGRIFWSIERANLCRFSRRDYLGDPKVPLREAVLDRVAAAGKPRPEGPVRMLTHLRMFGYTFNPVTFYFCFAKDGETLETIVAEITNTPWGERHSYVLESAAAEHSDGMMTFRFPKAFHVSPFMPMHHDYEWRFAAPDRRIFVHMRNFEAAREVFSATLSLERRPVTGGALAKAILLHPLMAARVLLYIYLQAAILKWRGAPFFDHPQTTTEGRNA